ncbi:MAG: GNAT family acetyltransferase YjcF, partial [uncultured Thermomicrobiales bacterium]
DHGGDLGASGSTARDDRGGGARGQPGRPRRHGPDRRPAAPGVRRRAADARRPLRRPRRRPQHPGPGRERRRNRRGRSPDPKCRRCPPHRSPNHLGRHPRRLARPGHRRGGDGCSPRRRRADRDPPGHPQRPDPRPRLLPPPRLRPGGGPLRGAGDRAPEDGAAGL